MLQDGLAIACSKVTRDSDLSGCSLFEGRTWAQRKPLAGRAGLKPARRAMCSCMRCVSLLLKGALEGGDASHHTRFSDSIGHFSKMKKLAGLLPVLCLAFCVSSKADTLTFNNVPGGGDIGPYSLTLGSTSSNLLLFCMNDTNFIQGGESWGVNVVNGANLTGPLASSYMEEAFIYSYYGADSANDVQLALWKVFNSSDDISGDATATALVAAAQNMSDPFYSNGSLAGYEFYLYNGGPVTNQYGSYPPQNFIGTSPTPEPSSLVLMGSGLVGLAGYLRRKLAGA